MVEIGLDELDQLEQICPGGVARGVDLSALSQWRVGGRADLMISPSTAGQVGQLRAWLNEKRLPHVVIGLTTNLLFSDDGLRVPCVKIATRMAECIIDANVVQVQAGVWVPKLTHTLMRHGLSGLEHACGIPGTLGGLIYMNGGSQRKGVSSSISAVQSVDSGGHIRWRSIDQISFSYRSSLYQSNAEIITAAELIMEPKCPSLIAKEMRSILAVRRKKFPRKEPNCGSVFKSNPMMYEEIGPPGAVIEKHGFKGFKVGGAMVSPKHANFIVNCGGATAKDIVDLIKAISDRIWTSTGFRMEAEAFYVDAWGRLLPIDNVR